MLKKLRGFALAGAAVSGLLAAAAPAAAATIVDTGANPDGIQWSFADFQYFAGEFTVSANYLIEQVEGYFDNRSQTTGTVTAKLFADGGNIPGDLLFSQTFDLPGGSPDNWYGISGLKWDVNAGTYWLAFAPDNNVSGAWRGGAPSPLGEYAQNSGGWQDRGADYFDYLDVGVRVSGTPQEFTAPLPEPATWAMMLIGFGAVGGTMRGAKRRKKVAVSYA